MLPEITLDFYSYEGIGYHGHKREIIEEIISNNEFKISVKEWNYAGDGIYFFHNDLRITIRWCKRARKYENWGIIKAKIQSDQVLDCDNNTHYEEIENFAKKIYDRYNNISGKKELTTRVLFNLIHQHKPFEIVKFTKKVPYGGGNKEDSHCPKSGYSMCKRS